MKILKINSSVNTETSISREYVDKLIAKLDDGNATVVDRDVTLGIPPTSQELVGAFYTPADELTAEQKEITALSDELIAEIKDADVIVIGLPIYNFGIPASLKAYIDQVSRAGHTFQFTDQGPVGLLEDKKTFIAVASGGTGLGSEQDFASTYMKSILGFLGIKDVHFVDATGLMLDREGVLTSANQQVEGLFVKS